MPVATPSVRSRAYVEPLGNPIVMTVAPAAGDTLPVPVFSGPAAVMYVSLASGNRTTDDTLAIQAARSDGQRLTICVTTANTLTIKDAAGTAFGSDVDVTSAQGVELVYDAAASVWRRC
jgi:hypothetical protein